MDAKVRKELDDLLSMVGHWKTDKLRQAGNEPGWEFLARDLMEEIDDHVAPYVRRLVECGYITEGERALFLDACLTQVHELSMHLWTEVSHDSK